MKCAEAGPAVRKRANGCSWGRGTRGFQTRNGVTVSQKSGRAGGGSEEVSLLRKPRPEGKRKCAADEKRSEAFWPGKGSQIRKKKRNRKGGEKKRRGGKPAKNLEKTRERKHQTRKIFTAGGTVRGGARKGKGCEKAGKSDSLRQMMHVKQRSSETKPEKKYAVDD